MSRIGPTVAHIRDTLSTASAAAPTSTRSQATFPSLAPIADRVIGQLRRGKFPARHVQRNDYAGQAWLDARNDVCKRVEGGGALIVLCGPRGTGKTQIATDAGGQVCYALPNQDTPAVYETAVGAFVSIRAAMKGDEGEEAAIRRLVAPTLLVIDDFQDRGETEWEDRILTHVIDRRYQDPAKSTVVITNLSPEAAATSLGPSVMDRVRECGAFIECRWESFRRAAKKGA